MDRVYFLKNFELIEKKTQELLRNFYLSNNNVLIKIHFGEPGNKFAFSVEDIRPVIKAMKSLELNPTFFDSIVAYNSPRDSVKGYEQAVREKGFDKLASFNISNIGIPVEVKDFTAYVCKELAEANNVLVVSHVKGHSCAGFGGAVKNLAMGGVTRETKKIQHVLCKPKFISECQGCGVCADLCPAKAIKMVDGKAQLDNSKCWGCSICQTQCPHKCLAPERASFDDLLGQSASAVIKNLPAKTFYINFLKNIVMLCDCETDPGEIISKDIGVLFSSNPVAIDKASIDIINKVNHKNLFEETNHKNPLLHVEYASEYIGKSMDYDLVLV